jgi:hypothetical protein
MNRPQRDPGGPVIAVCTGQRCSARRRLQGPDGGIEPLKTAASRTRGAVLVSTGCLGRCELAATVLVVWRGDTAGEPLPLAGMEAVDRSQALATWLPGPGPAISLLHGGRLPPALAAARAAADPGRLPIDPTDARSI